MSGTGKNTTSTQAVSIPPQVLAQYQTVNAQAQQTAQTPFQQYGGQFVAPVNAQQNTGISGINSSANEAQPYYGAATDVLGATQANTTPTNDTATALAAQSAGAVNPSALTPEAIQQYLSPYLGTVLGSTASLINQNNQQAQAGQLGTAISSGAFGGDRTGLAAANLQQQENLAAGNIYSGIANTGYMNAQGVAQQQQGVGLAAGQANRAAVAAAGQELSTIGATTYGEGANTASELGALGTGAQTAGLTGAQAQIGAGTLQQQTQQAQDTAQYNQFLQQQSYPFQVDQFLANIAEGTGALSGSTTTTTQPGGFFSDRRLKHNVRKIGKTFDGQPIYSYSMHGDPRTQIGLIAQDVEKKHPESVGVAGHYKVVDYGKATEEAANRGHFYSGGVVPLRRAYQGGGGPVIQYAGSPSSVSPVDLSNILAAQRDMYAPYSGGTGMYGSKTSGPYGGVGHVPPPSGAVAHLVTPQGGAPRGPTVLENTKSLTDLATQGQKLYQGLNKKSAPDQPAYTGPTTIDASLGAGTMDATASGIAAPPPVEPDLSAGQARGGVAGYQDGGNVGDEVPTELNIPDTGSSTSKPATQQPPALQNQNHDLQDIASLVGIAGGIAAMAAKRGGRIGYADGGSPDDTDQPDQTDLGLEGPPTPDAPPSDSTPVPTKIAGVAPTEAAKDTDHWYKHAANVVPLLTGLAAMGTAPTRHLGVALSAGLGAGAQSWLPAQEAGQDIRSKEIANQLASMKVQAAGDYFNPTPTPGVAPSPTSTTPGSPTQQKFRDQFFVPPWTPQETAAYHKAYGASIALNSQAPVQDIETKRQARIQQATATNKNQAQAIADDAYRTATTSTDPAARQQAADTYDSAFQWTGDKISDVAGSIRNTRTGAPPIGAALQTLTPMQAFQRFVELAGPTDYGAQGKISFLNWAKQNKIPIPEGWSPQGGAGVPGVAPPAPAAAPPSGVAAGATPPAAPGAPATKPAPTAPIPVRRPADQQALLDRLHGKPGATLTAPAPSAAQSAVTPPGEKPLDWSKMTPRPSWAMNPYGVPPSPKANDEYTAAHYAVKDEAGRLPSTQTQLVNVTRMQNELANAKTGPLIDRIADLQKTLGNLTGSQLSNLFNSNPAAYDLLTKGLGNQALRSQLDAVKEGGGASIRLGAMESNLIINKLSASPEMAKGAIRTLLSWQQQQLSYEQEKENAALEYLKRNGDATEFPNWYANQRPLASSVSTAAPAETGLGRGTPPPGTNDKGGVLHHDAKGNYAYKNPDGTWEEVKH